jgi:hypothetical protein
MSAFEVLDIYDAELTDIDASARRITFHADGQELTFDTPHPDVWQAGMVGRLTLRSDGTFSFRAYCDPRLRRDASADDIPAKQWGWRLGDYRFQVKAGVTPGINGTVIREDLRRLTIDLPREFVDLCEAHRLPPGAALRAFIADVCALQNFVTLPREDGYCSLGSDERLFARQYWERAHDWRRECLAVPGVASAK